jgi:hypothetical protein
MYSDSCLCGDCELIRKLRKQPDDIVERLRDGTHGTDAWCESVSEMVGYWHPLADEAADEIERLRAEVAHLLNELRLTFENEGLEVPTWLDNTAVSSDTDKRP